jgi:hypothetical protein
MSARPSALSIGGTQSRIAHVAHGKPPVAHGTWTTIDLTPWLGAPGVPAGALAKQYRFLDLAHPSTW